MSASRHINNLLEKTGLTMYALGKILGLKSKAHVWLFVNGDRNPSVSTCKKLIKFAKENGVELTIDMLREDG